MVIALLIIGIITLFWARVLFCMNSTKAATFGEGVFGGVILSVLLIADFALLGAILKDPKPAAMDVYQGKTTLEYKVVDGVKIDSIVILKNNNHGKEN